jgi:hypothetical protein
MKKMLTVLLMFICLNAYAELKWEKISEGQPNGLRDAIYRAAVPHGWFVIYTKKSLHFANEKMDFGNIAFYPDENHEWNL